MAKLRMFMATYHDLSILGDVKKEVFRTLEEAEKSSLESVVDTWCDFVELYEIDFEKGELNYIKKIDSVDLEEEEVEEPRTELKRVTFYFLNHEDMSDAEIVNSLERNDYVPAEQIKIETVDIGVWSDDHRCNLVDYDLSQEFKEDDK